MAHEITFAQEWNRDAVGSFPQPSNQMVEGPCHQGHAQEPAPDTCLKNRRGRIHYNKDQRKILEDVFSRFDHPSKGVRKDLARTLCLDEERIDNWFKNRRAKARGIKVVAKKKRHPEQENSAVRVNQFQPVIQPSMDNSFVGGTASQMCSNVNQQYHLAYRQSPGLVMPEGNGAHNVGMYSNTDWTACPPSQPGYCGINMGEYAGWTPMQQTSPVDTNRASISPESLGVVGFAANTGRNYTAVSYTACPPQYVAPEQAFDGWLFQ